jgi:hypothetical protein
MTLIDFLSCREVGVRVADGVPVLAGGARGQACGMLLGCWSEWCDMGNWR